MRLVDTFAGVAYGFFRAGAPSIVAPLWQVHDLVAKAFALEFYEQWLRPDVPLYLAFQRAVLELKEKTPFPETWSSWQLIGGWNTQALDVRR